tara:strand:+ start:780 stop:1178 length:399 start_codon:yes stop_codon:yes gene_type:complete
MENKYKEIASSNQGLNVLGQFLGQVDQQGVFDPAKEFLKNKAKNLIKRESTNKSNETSTGSETDNKQLSVVEKGQNLINRVKNLPIDISTKGVGFEKTFGDKDKGFNATVFGRQDFGKPADYGAKLGFNFKF